MIEINEKEYKEIVNVIEKNLCRYCSAYTCSEADCDIQNIYAILNKHIFRECNNNIAIDEDLPFN